MNFKSFLLLCLIALLPLGCLGCRKGPAVAVLQEDLQSQLNDGFQEGLFDVDSFRRMGAYSSLDDSSGLEELLVYFDAELVFLRDYAMSDWNALGLEALLNILGAGEKGISGINPKGNKRGDRCLVHGTLSYVRKDGQWLVSVDNSALRASSRKSHDSVLKAQQKEIEVMLEEIKDLSVTALREEDSKGVEQVHSFVRVTRNRLVKRLSKDKKQELVIGTANVVGTYYPLGKALAENLSKNGIPCRVQQTEGSTENCKMVHHGYADLAVCQNDVAFQAHSGRGSFSRESLDGISALCSWYPEPIQIFVLKGSSFEGISDLRGRTIIVGQGKSGTRVNALQVLRTAGFSEEDLGHIKEAPYSTGFEMLDSGEAAAVFLTQAYPARVLRGISPSSKKIQLLSLKQSLVSKLVAEYPFFVPLKIPAKHYRGLKNDINTVAVTALLIARKTISKDKVARILEIQYANLDEFIKAHPKGSVISRDNGLEGLSIPLHPGAEDFFSKK